MKVFTRSTLAVLLFAGVVALTSCGESPLQAASTRDGASASFAVAQGRGAAPGLPSPWDGYEIVESSSTVGGGVALKIVFCPPGKVVIGGGFFTSAGLAVPAEENGPAIMNGQVGWRARFSGGGGTNAMFVRAICVNGPPPIHTIEP